MNNKKENVYAKTCPADAIREYIEKIANEQKRLSEEGKEIPTELCIPREIILSPENIKFLLNSKFVDYIGAGETGNEIQFYWKKTDELPALDVRVKRNENGKYVLTYIKEEATKDKDEFLWDISTTDGKNGYVTISKIGDALEDICDMVEMKRGK